MMGKDDFEPLDEALARACVLADGKDPDAIWCRFGDANHAKWKTHIPDAKHFRAMLRAVQEHEAKTCETARQLLGRLYPADVERDRIVALIRARMDALARDGDGQGTGVIRLNELVGILDQIQKPQMQEWEDAAVGYLR